MTLRQANYVPHASCLRHVGLDDHHPTTVGLLTLVFRLDDTIRFRTATYSRLRAKEAAVVLTDNLNIANSSQFVLTPHGCAPAVEAPAPFAVTVGADNSGAA